MSHVMWNLGEKHPRKDKKNCKGPEAEACLVLSWKNRVATEAKRKGEMGEQKHGVQEGAKCVGPVELGKDI